MGTFRWLGSIFLLTSKGSFPRPGPEDSLFDLEDVARLVSEAHDVLREKDLAVISISEVARPGVGEVRTDGSAVEDRSEATADQEELDLRSRIGGVGSCGELPEHRSDSWVQLHMCSPCHHRLLGEAMRNGPRLRFTDHLAHIREDRVPTGLNALLDPRFPEVRNIDTHRR